MRFIAALLLALIVATCCQAQTPGTVYIIDDGEAVSGEWNYANNVPGLFNDCYYAYEGAVRSYAFEANPGTYRIWVRWVSGENGSGTWTVSAAGDTLLTATVNGLTEPSEVEMEGMGWKQLDDVVVTATDVIEVDVSVLVGSFFCPDAIAYMRVDDVGGGGEDGEAVEVFLTDSQWAEFQEIALLIRFCALACGWQCGSLLWSHFLISKQQRSFL